jgi:hypothetical protein
MLRGSCNETGARRPAAVDCFATLARNAAINESGNMYFIDTDLFQTKPIPEYLIMLYWI